MPGKVMVIEDDEVISRSIARRLIAGGFSVLSAYAASQAMPRARNEGPDLIIIDDWLPGGTGVQLMGRMLNVPSLSTIPMILMVSSPDLVDDALTMGARDTVPKPVDVNDLCDRVAAILGGSAPAAPTPAARRVDSPPLLPPSWDSMPFIATEPPVLPTPPAGQSAPPPLPSGPLLSTLDAAELERFSHLAAAVLGASAGFIAAPSDSGPELVSHWLRDAPSSTPWQSPLTRFLARLTVDLAEVFPVNDVRKHPLVRANAAVGEHGVEAYLGTPVLDDGTIVGVIGAVDAEARLFTEDHAIAITALAELLVEHARLRARR